ncbi:helix-turn-helix domain-containing protein [Halomonas sp. M4R1S46]|uniref:helix-turn-helix domain-containing protein n=1 Tax=Halomonas sp. M4R1S46 TaxID=2982692 RepID=UPI00398E90F1
MGYQKLTQTQRYQIHARYDLGISQRQIGRELGIHSSTISRELRRNATASGYDPEQALSLSDHRRRTSWKWTRHLPSMIAASPNGSVRTRVRSRSAVSSRPWPA